ncbi:hypothetical protein E6C27_scaffold226G00520 [Cucumis melo var. makuwa]|uniref:Uncharacterized protein n=1 Tax=Cucumis melo var. makuwa TaxID=1194695 RepID=A0A5A7UK80_CUCMM|nr:hypothetical protein E6C27_scaffold226G00520 [Cucumis melo var. makuwa]
MNWVWKLGKLAIPMDLKALKPYLVQLLPRLPLNHLVPRALFEDEPHSANDAWRKLHSDALLII